MSDLIERQAAISLAGDLQIHGDEYHMYNQAINNYCAELIKLPSAQPEIIRCKDCKHRPVTNDDYNSNDCDCGFDIEFPDYRCPCQCEDGYYNWLPDDNWFCGNAERKTDE